MMNPLRFLLLSLDRFFAKRENKKLIAFYASKCANDVEWFSSSVRDTVNMLDKNPSWSDDFKRCSLYRVTKQILKTASDCDIFDKEKLWDVFKRNFNGFPPSILFMLESFSALAIEGRCRISKNENFDTWLQLVRFNDYSPEQLLQIVLIQYGGKS